MESLTCGHVAPAAGRACRHLLSAPEAPYSLFFTGQGDERHLVCEDCERAEEPAARADSSLCLACLRAREGRPFGLISLHGKPEARTRRTSLRFEHRDHPRPELEGTTPRAITPMGAEPRSRWLAVDARGGLLQLDLDAGTTTRLGALPPDSVQLDADLELHVSACGGFAAVANRYGSRGVVIALGTGAVTMKLERGDYHETRCVFPLAFFEDGGHARLVHGTRWNRLDISDPATGALLTPRDDEPPGEDTAPAHALDYFHCGLTVSPDGQWLADDGWVWHPVGVLTTLSLRRWLHENVWESEDGPSRRQLRDIPYFWDGPCCFVDARTLAVWGLGSNPDRLLDAALLFDVESGALLRWFPGPRGALRADGRFLLASAVEGGTQVWDWETGERLHEEPGLVPTSWHPAARCLLTVRDDGSLRESRLVQPEPGSGGP
ncbi:hypothetical protein LY474_35980 [Myxococcus stipitatus]|uniref:WD40 repeat domain-containing protein n=1 Tax=Myxococcus stipitatus TaxID=83455 RepID=UPI001F30A702|nr:hypothetical protein [Myxococcus stipitatus]MCE9673221.1 hypothetical protein [Myxococcus stipitatus]